MAKKRQLKSPGLHLELLGVKIHVYAPPGTRQRLAAMSAALTLAPGLILGTPLVSAAEETNIAGVIEELADDTGNDGEKVIICNVKQPGVTQITNDQKQQILIDPYSLVLLNPNTNEVVSFSANGDWVTGTVNPDELLPVLELSPEEAKSYTSIISTSSGQLGLYSPSQKTTLMISPEGAVTVSVTKYVNTSSDPLKLREMPGLSSTVLSEIPRGSSVKVLGESEEDDGLTWVKVEYYLDESKEPEVGWVAEKYLSDIEPETPEQNNDDVTNNTETLEIKYVNTSSDPLKLREMPGLSSTVLSEIPRGSSVKVLGESEEDDGLTWVKVEYYLDESKEPEVGWVAEKYLSDIEPETPEQNNDDVTNNTEILEIKYVNTLSDPLKFREMPGLSSTILSEIPRGSSVKVLGESEEKDGLTWVKVEYYLDESEEPELGWVAEKYLSDIEPETIRYVKTPKGR